MKDFCVVCIREIFFYLHHDQLPTSHILVYPHSFMLMYGVSKLVLKL